MSCEGPFGVISRDRDPLGDPPFGQFHRLFALAFNIFKAWHIGTLGEIMAIQQLAQWVRRLSGLLFFVLSAAFVPFLLISVHALFFNPNT
uniref:Uncharacterized protein n=1 Tax=Solanum tuberosum TaxID=4113 RepID=M1DM01_SOLTU